MVNWALKARTSAAKNSFIESQERKIREKQEGNKRDMFRNNLINEEIVKANRQRVIRTLEIDSENWLNPENLDEKIDRLLVIPDVVETQNDYYRKLQDVITSLHPFRVLIYSRSWSVTKKESSKTLTTKSTRLTV